MKLQTRKADRHKGRDVWPIRVSGETQSTVLVLNLDITGGDLRRLAEHLGDEAGFVPNMVLSGIAVAARCSSSPPGKG